MPRLHLWVIAGVILLSAKPAFGQSDPIVEPNTGDFSVGGPSPNALGSLRSLVNPPLGESSVAGSVPNTLRILNAGSTSFIPSTSDPGVTGRVPKALRSALEALGASSGVPDGIGFTYLPREAVRNEPTKTMSLLNLQFGATVPVYTTETDLFFANASVRALDIRTNAILPTDHVHFPRSLWDIQAGGGYVGQLANGWSWGVALNLGTASDEPFAGLSEDTLSALVFVRVPQGERNGWLFYVLSSTVGQLGRNIPVPGVAYEYHTDTLTAVVGFPFVTINYRPIQSFQFELLYAALTEVESRVSYYFLENARIFAGFEWLNQAWFRADRQDKTDQLFLYEKRVEGGLGWLVDKRIDLRFSAGYAFDRFFVENHGLSFNGRNRTDIAPGVFATFQAEFKY